MSRARACCACRTCRTLHHDRWLVFQMRSSRPLRVHTTARDVASATTARTAATARRTMLEQGCSSERCWPLSDLHGTHRFSHGGWVMGLAVAINPPTRVLVSLGPSTIRLFSSTEPLLRRMSTSLRDAACCTEHSQNCAVTITASLRGFPCSPPRILACLSNLGRLQVRRYARSCSAPGFRASRHGTHVHQSPQS